jgi:hypothetical protein
LAKKIFDNVNENAPIGIEAQARASKGGGSMAFDAMVIDRISQNTTNTI